MTAAPAPPWTHQQLQSDLYQRRKRRKATIAWSEIEIPGTTQGRFDVYEARHHDARSTTTFVGFEVKANRRDLESDLSTGKWRKYLPACDQLFFAMPTGLCDGDDIPEPAGILWRTEDRFAGQWRIGRHPKPNSRETPDVEIWRRLATRQYWSPTAPEKDRLERMREYAEMQELSHLISTKVRAEITAAYGQLLQDRNRYEQTENRIEHLEELESRLGAAPALLAATAAILRAAARQTDATWPQPSLEEALDVIREGSSR